jgi:prenylcysteine oxidase/farnesylcysteine lyase
MSHSKRHPPSILSIHCITLSLALLLLCILPSSLHAHASRSKPLLRVGIIGSGISGASSAHWLQSALGQQFDLRMTCLEKTDRIGGRIQSVHLDDPSERWENGASILHTSNLYMRYFTRILNLTLQEPPRKLEKSMAIWNGEEFLLQLSGSTLWDAYEILKRYGWDFFRLKSAISGVAENFQRIYQAQDHGLVFDGPEDLLKAIGLYNLTQQTLYEWLSANLSEDGTILQELAAASTRVNYNQGLGINALAGAVGLIPLTDPNLFAVEEGNVRVVEGLLARENVHVKKSHTVKLIERRIGPDAPSGYIISGTTGAQQNFSVEVDVVIIAAPLEDSGISFRIPDQSSARPSSEFLPQPEKRVREFQTTHTTWVRGRVREEAFRKRRKDITRGEPDSDSSFEALSTTLPSVPGMILTTEDEKLDFTSITAYSSFPQLGTTPLSQDSASSSPDLRTYKIFSRHKFTDALVQRYFTQVDRNQVRRTEWKAYPKYSPPESFAPSFRVYPHPNGPLRSGEDIYYPLALEHSASCIEVEIVAARNVAAQVARRWKERKRSGKVKGARGEPAAGINSNQHDEL